MTSNSDLVRGYRVVHEETSGNYGTLVDSIAQKNASKKSMTGNGHIELFKVTSYNFQPSRAR